MSGTRVVSYCEVDSRGRRSDRLWDLFQVFLPERFRTPSSWSIICSSSVWSSALSGATEISRTARNSPQLFRCSFSRRKKFHTKRLQWGRWGGHTSHRGCSAKLVVRNKLCSDPPEDLERSQHGGQDVAHRVDLGHCDQRNLDRPSKTQDHIFHNRAVVVGLDTEQTGLVSVWVGRARRLNQTYLMWINDFFSEEDVFASSTIKQTPVHTQIPDQCVQGADDWRHNQKVEEGVGVCVTLLWKKTHEHNLCQRLAFKNSSGFSCSKEKWNSISTLRAGSQLFYYHFYH